MTVASFQYCWTARPDVHVPDGWTAISDADLAHGGVKGLRIESMAEPGDHMPAWAWDFLQVARAAYVADKKSRRDSAADGWTRTIHLRVPIRRSGGWSTSTAELLCSLLQVLTADLWDVSFEPGSSAWARQGRIVHEWKAQEVALFSGGLDSTAFAANLAASPGEDVLLVMFFDPATKSRQAAVFDDIKKIEHDRRCIHRRDASQMVIGGPLEPSSRSRGLLYIATAVYMAAAHGASRVLLPENGQLAVNLPLTPARAAACSTRSVHPRTLELLNQLIRTLGGDVIVANPLGDLTKGEVCDLALQAGLSSHTLFTTVSCGHPPHSRDASRPYHCGYCYPCLVRRAGLWHALGEDGTSYLHDPWQLPNGDRKTEDLLALLLWLSKPLTSTDLIADMPLPAGSSINDLMLVQHRARAEIATMLNEILPERGPFRDIWQPSP